MVNLFSPPSFIQLYAECIDDSLPKFKPENWIKEGRWYKVKHFAESLNTDGMSVTITDNKNEEIHPSPSMFSFKQERFIIHEICLN